MIAREGNESFEVENDTERILLRAIEQCERGETIPMIDLLGELRARK